MADGIPLSVFNILIPQRDGLYKKRFSFLALSLVNSQNPTNCTVFFLSFLYYIATVNKYCPDDKIEKNEMSGACSAYGGESRRIQDFVGEV